MDREKVKWALENIELLVSMIKDEIEIEVEPKESKTFETFHPLDLDGDIEYYEED